MFHVSCTLSKILLLLHGRELVVVIFWRVKSMKQESLLPILKFGCLRIIKW